MHNLEKFCQQVRDELEGEGNLTGSDLLLMDKFIAKLVARAKNPTPYPAFFKTMNPVPPDNYTPPVPEKYPEPALAKTPISDIQKKIQIGKHHHLHSNWSAVDSIDHIQPMSVNELDKKNMIIGDADFDKSQSSQVVIHQYGQPAYGKTEIMLNLVKKTPTKHAFVSLELPYESIYGHDLDVIPVDITDKEDETDSPPSP